MGDGIIVADSNGYVLAFNPAAERLLGKKPERGSGRWWIEEYGLFAPDRLTPLSPSQLPLRRAIRGEQVEGTEVFLRNQQHPLGIWVSCTASPLRDEQHFLRGGIVVFRDISDRKAAEQELRNSNERFNIISKTTNDAIWDWDLDTNNVWWNEGVSTLFGYKPDEIEEQITWWYERVHPDDRERVVNSIHAAIDRGDSFWCDEYRYARADKKYANVLDRAHILVDENSRPSRLIGAMNDITERKRAEAALQESQRLLSTLVSNLPGLAYRRNNNREWTFEFVSDGIVDLTGYSAADFLEGPVQFSDLIHPEDVDYVWSEIQSALHDRRRYQLLYRIHTAEGKEKWVWEKGCGVFTEDFRLVALEGFVTDITERKRAEERFAQLYREAQSARATAELAEIELKRQTSELARSNKELQQFAYIASHDLKEPLRMVTTYLKLLERRYYGNLDADAHDFIKFAVGGADRMYLLINDLLAYSRVGTHTRPFNRVPCAKALESALANLRSTISEAKAEVTSGALPEVFGDPTQLVQLFQNLIGNAVKFRGDRSPHIHVSAENLGDEWIFSVKDNGIGIDAQYASRIFVIFQRLHGREEYPGTGIGLAICKKIVERHGGRIWFESVPGEGSNFLFSLPRTP